jgi:cation diffusion facilitator family transporter
MHDINRSRESIKVTVIGALVNALLAVAKIVGGSISNSQALIADGIHSLSDLISDVLVWYAARHAAQEADEKHPYGHARFETAATMGLGILLIGAAVMILYDAGSKLWYGEITAIPGTLALLITIFSIFANEGLYWLTIHTANKIHSSMLRANAWHHRTDAVSSIVVLIGIGGAMLGLTWFDAVAAIIVGLMIGRIGWKFGKEAIQELVDSAGLDAEQLSKLEASISAVAGVKNLHLLRSRRLGHEIMLDVHVQVHPMISVSEGHMISVNVAQTVSNQLTHLRDITVHIDPEDDEDIPIPAIGALPERGAILRHLERVVPEAYNLEVHRTTLHYLNERVILDCVVPLSTLKHYPADTIADTLRQLLKPLPWCGGVRVFYLNKED